MRGIVIVLMALAAQWQGYPTPGIPRTADGKPNLTAPAPRTPDGKPDLSGIWQSTVPRFNIAAGMKKGETVPFQPWAAEVFKERAANNSKDDPGARCLPTGLPMRATLATPMKIVQIPSVTLILYESRTTFRQIFTDGRPLPKVIDWPAFPVCAKFSSATISLTVLRIPDGLMHTASPAFTEPLAILPANPRKS